MTISVPSPITTLAENTLVSRSSLSRLAISRLMIRNSMPWKIVVRVVSVLILVRSSMSLISKTAEL